MNVTPHGRRSHEGQCLRALTLGNAGRFCAGLEGFLSEGGSLTL